VDFPSAINCSTWRSREVKGSAGISVLELYAAITAAEMPGLEINVSTQDLLKSP